MLTPAPFTAVTATESGRSAKSTAVQPNSSCACPLWPSASRIACSTIGWATCWPASAASPSGRFRPSVPDSLVTSRPVTVVQNTMSFDQSTAMGARSLTVPAKDHRRNSSIVRAEVVFARGRSEETCSRGSTTIDDTPWWVSSMAVARPVGPPPTTSTLVR
jgi:hypothetical protein